MNKGDLMNRVYQSDLTKRATLVMFYLINRADKELTCFPGIKTIARECGISSRTVQRALNDLEEARFVNKESRYHEQGGQRSNLYILVLEEKKEETDNKISFEKKIISKGKEGKLSTKLAIQKKDCKVLKIEDGVNWDDFTPNKSRKFGKIQLSILSGSVMNVNVSESYFLRSKTAKEEHNVDGAFVSCRATFNLATKQKMSGRVSHNVPP